VGTLVYDPLAHWVWGSGGWLRSLGALDFAGGTVVQHQFRRFRLVAALVLGPRLGLGKESMDPHDATMAVLGAVLLWFGWFGFNRRQRSRRQRACRQRLCGDEHLGCDGRAHLDDCELGPQGKAERSGSGRGGGRRSSGDHSRLRVRHNPGIGPHRPRRGVMCYFATQLRGKLRVDDALDVWGVHGVGGTWGALATGLFATLAVNEAGANGLLYGDPSLLWKQLVAVVVTWVYAGAATWILLKLVDVTVGLRVAEREEVLGLDATQHGSRVSTGAGAVATAGSVGSTTGPRVDRPD